jgi:hypothetical protein
MRIRLISCLVVLLLFAFTMARADIVYQVNVNTSSISGTAGSLDFNFNPGPLVSQAANLQILNFTSDGALAGNCPCGTGDVSGQLPATLTFDNGTGFNDYFDGFTFGNAISFEVSLYGPALSPPYGTATSGSTFVFSMFSDPAGTIPALTNDLVNGFAITVDINLDGTTTAANFSSQTTVSPVPEPSTTLLVGPSLLGLAGALRRRLRV